MSSQDRPLLRVGPQQREDPSPRRGRPALPARAARKAPFAARTSPGSVQYSLGRRRSRTRSFASNAPSREAASEQRVFQHLEVSGDRTSGDAGVAGDTGDAQGLPVQERGDRQEADESSEVPHCRLAADLFPAGRGRRSHAVSGPDPPKRQRVARSRCGGRVPGRSPSPISSGTRGNISLRTALPASRFGPGPPGVSGRSTRAGRTGAPRSSIRRWTSFRSAGARWTSSHHDPRLLGNPRHHLREAPRAADQFVKERLVQEIEAGRIGKFRPRPGALSDPAAPRTGKKLRCGAAVSRVYNMPLFYGRFFCCRAGKRCGIDRRPLGYASGKGDER